jgi:general secretion pathway protein C
MAVATPEAPKSSLAGNVLVIALVLVLAWQAAYWTWVLPHAAQRAAGASSQPAVDLAAVARLFGGERPGDGRGASNLKLKGVIAPTPGTVASAIFSTGAGRDVAVYIDGEVEPGVMLSEVHPDHVIVSRAGVRGRIDLEAPRGANVAARGVPGRATGFKLNVARTGSNKLQPVAQGARRSVARSRPAQLLGQIGTPPKGGVRMELAPPGSLAQKLGLQPGDVIRKLNGQPVASAGDLARLYTQFNSLSLIQAEIQRGQSTLQLSYRSSREGPHAAHPVRDEGDPEIATLVASIRARRKGALHQPRPDAAAQPALRPGLERAAGRGAPQPRPRSPRCASSPSARWRS